MPTLRELDVRVNLLNHALPAMRSLQQLRIAQNLMSWHEMRDGLPRNSSNDSNVIRTTTTATQAPEKRPHHP